MAKLRILLFEFEYHMDSSQTRCCFAHLSICFCLPFSPAHSFRFNSFNRLIRRWILPIPFSLNQMDDVKLHFIGFPNKTKLNQCKKVGVIFFPFQSHYQKPKKKKFKERHLVEPWVFKSMPISIVHYEQMFHVFCALCHLIIMTDNSGLLDSKKVFMCTKLHKHHHHRDFKIDICART